MRPYKQKYMFKTTHTANICNEFCVKCMRNPDYSEHILKITNKEPSVMDQYTHSALHVH